MDIGVVARVSGESGIKIDVVFTPARGCYHRADPRWVSIVGDTITNFVVIILRRPRAEVRKGDSMIHRPLLKAEVVFLGCQSRELRNRSVDRRVYGDRETAPACWKEVCSIARRKEEGGNGLPRLRGR